MFIKCESHFIGREERKYHPYKKSSCKSADLNRSSAAHYKSDGLAKKKTGVVESLEPPSEIDKEQNKADTTQLSPVHKRAIASDIFCDSIETKRRRFEM